LLTDRDNISNRYRGPSKDASYQVLIYLVEKFQKRTFFRDQPMVLIGWFLKTSSPLKPLCQVNRIW
jgi:hypothetical protein